MKNAGKLRFYRLQNRSSCGTIYNIFSEGDGTPCWTGPRSAPYTAEQLLEVIRILRDPENGCPWDKVQTHASIRKNFLEETCEALEAIDADDAVPCSGRNWATC